jgi:hypothetical protein
MVQNLLTLSELNRPLRSSRKGRQVEILSFAGKMRKTKDSQPIGDIDSTDQVPFGQKIVCKIKLATAANTELT